MTRVLALGTFDLFHAGHVAFLKRARAEGDHLTVSVNRDAFAAKFKRPPIMSLDERLAVVYACKWVDEVAILSSRETTPGLIVDTASTVIVHGDDWTGDSYKQQLGVTDEWLAEHGVEIRYVPYTAGISTSEIIQRLFERANRENPYLPSEYITRCASPR